MSENQLVKLAQFNSFEEAKELVDFLKGHEINAKIEDASPAGDLSFGGNDLSKEINDRHTVRGSIHSSRRHLASFTGIWRRWCAEGRGASCN